MIDTLDDDLRQEAAPYTEDYFKYVADNTARIISGHGFFKYMDNQITEEEKRAGWHLKEQVPTLSNQSSVCFFKFIGEVHD